MTNGYRQARVLIHIHRNMRMHVHLQYTCSTPTHTSTHKDIPTPALGQLRPLTSPSPPMCSAPHCSLVLRRHDLDWVKSDERAYFCRRRCSRRRTRARGFGAPARHRVRGTRSVAACSAGPRAAVVGRVRGRQQVIRSVVNIELMHSSTDLAHPASIGAQG